MGPMALGDLVGQELFWKQRKVGWEKTSRCQTVQGGALGSRKKRGRNIYAKKKVKSWILKDILGGSSLLICKWLITMVRKSSQNGIIPLPNGLLNGL